MDTHFGEKLLGLPKYKWKHYPANKHNGEVWESDDFQIEIYEPRHGGNKYDVEFSYEGSNRRTKSSTTSFPTKSEAMTYCRKLKKSPCRAANSLLSTGRIIY